MAITKILARKGRLDVGIRYVLNGDKTQEQILTAHLNCDPGRELRQMLETKAQYGKEDGVQYYHIIQSFRPGEVSPELALEIARTLVEEHMPGYQAVIGVHVDKEHIHAHIIFNSVNADTGEKYHSSPQSYYRQIRAISDRLCREHGLSVILEGQGARAVSYAEWLRQTRGQPTFRAMLEADLRDAIQDANDLGHFFLLMEHKGWEIKHGNRLGFRLRGQDRFMMPGRKKSLFTEEGIRAAIQGELSAIEQGLRPAIIPRPAYPGILDTETFQCVQSRIQEKTAKQTPKAERQILKLSDRLHCGSCGSTLYRMGGKNHRKDTLYLKCAHCGISITIQDEILLEEVIHQMEEWDRPEQTSYQPSGEVIRLTNAINRGLEHPDDPQEVISLILQGAAARYACCPDTQEHINRPLDVCWEHIRLAVSHINISEENTVKVTFQQEHRERTEHGTDSTEAGTDHTGNEKC